MLPIFEQLNYFLTDDTVDRAKGSANKSEYIDNNIVSLTIFIYCSKPAEIFRLLLFLLTIVETSSPPTINHIQLIYFSLSLEEQEQAKRLILL